jgi:hypothetical protein
METITQSRGGRPRSTAASISRWIAALAALAYVPALYLHFAVTAGPWAVVGALLWWLVWAAFAARLVVDLAVAGDRRAYLARHRLFLFVVCFGLPVLPAVFKAVPVLGILKVLGLFEIVDLAKLGEASGLLRREAGGRVLSALASGLLVLVASVLALSALGAIMDRAHWARTPDPLAYLGSVLDNLLHSPATEGYGALLGAALTFALTVVLSSTRE